MVKMLSVNSIVSHKDNPRKSLGELTELSDSIKVNGILQPLTVVALADGMFKLIIGHRRLEAAKMAGLDTVPCEVSTMSEEQQLNVMMMENMLRENLTTYEEAKGFQMMLDLGKSVEQVASETGFSQTTIRKRTKLLDLNEEKFKKAVDRGTTLTDLCELNKIESEATRNAVLEFAGTAEFRSKLNRAIDNEEREHQILNAEAKIAEWATLITTMGYVGDEAVSMRMYKNWWPGSDVPEKGDGEAYYYTKSSFGISIYEKGNPTREAEEQERREIARQIEHELHEVSASCYRLRLDFLARFKAIKKYGDLIMRRFMKAAFEDRMRQSWRSCGNMDAVKEILGVEVESFDALSDYPIEKVALAFIAADADSPSNCTWRSVWDGTKFIYRYERNDKLIEYYEFLKQLGYEISEEEVKMLNGDVENVIKEAE